MSNNNLSKYVEEVKNVIFDFTNVLTTGETISTFATKIQALETVEPALAMINGTTIVGNTIVISVTSGYRTGSYLLYCSATTNGGRILTDTITVNVL